MPQESLESAYSRQEKKWQCRERTRNKIENETVGRGRTGIVWTSSRDTRGKKGKALEGKTGRKKKKREGRPKQKEENVIEKILMHNSRKDWNSGIEMTSNRKKRSKIHKRQTRDLEVQEDLTI